MEKYRVKFFSAQDMSSGINLMQSEEILKQINVEYFYNNINEVIELYNIKLYFDNEVMLSTWLEEEIEVYRTKVQSFLGIIGKYMNTLNNNNILEVIEEIDIDYTIDFWEIFNKFKVYKKISSDKFKIVLQHSKVSMHDVLKYVKTINYFSFEIRDQLVSSPEYAELLVENYLQGHDFGWKLLYFPNSFSLSDRENLIFAYLESENPNFIMLKLISKAQNSAELPLSAKAILMARRRYQEAVNTHFANSAGIESRVEVSFSQDQVDTSFLKRQGLSIVGIYSSRWVKENLEYPTVLNNYIYLFGYVDNMFRSQFVHKKMNLGIFERTMLIKGRKDYYTSESFNQISILNNLQIRAYDMELKRNRVDLLHVFKWFFEIYLLEEFGVNDFKFNVPSENSTFLEKCRFITSEVESILKQFKLFVEDGIIDHELLQITSEHIFMKNIPSLIEQKYFYHGDEKFRRVGNYLFSDQCLLAYVKRISKSYKSFYDLIRSEQIRRDDYNFKEPWLEWLIENGYIKVNSSGFLEVASDEVYIFRDLYINDVSCTSYWKNNMTIISNMAVNKKIRFSSSLFSEPEQDYMNYILNRSEFSNGLDLRNRYSHGTHPSASYEEIHRDNYYIFLKLITLIIIKINEEFCLREINSIISENSSIADS